MTDFATRALGGRVPDGFRKLPNALAGGGVAGADASSWWAANRKLFFVTWGICALLAALKGALGDPTPFGIGRDPDDAMRVLQLRDLLEGAGWWDLRQARLGIGGTEMHWSRLADLPYLLVAGPLSPLLGVERALVVAGTVVPGLVSGLFALGLMRGVSALRSSREALPPIVAGVVVLHLLAFGSRFSMGAFDHHHLQIGFLAVALGFTLIARPSARDGVVAALACAASTVIGLESAPFIIGICGVWALRWALASGTFSDGTVPDGPASDGALAGATRAFGLALGLAAMTGLLLFSPSRVWTQAVCDAFGLPLAGLLALGGFGLAGLSAAAILRTAPTRLGALAALGAVALATVAMGAPQCLGNPMDELPLAVREGWLAYISEARPLTHPSQEAVTQVFLVSLPLVAGVVGMIWAWRARVPRLGLLALTTLSAAGLLFYQVRFFTFCNLLAGFVMAYVLLRLLEWDTHADGRSVSPLARLPLVLLAMVGSSALAMAAAAALVLPSEDEAEATNATSNEDDTPCAGEALDTALAALPSGLVFTDMDDAPHILLTSPHRVLAGNYHRGASDIALWLDLAATPPATAARALRAAGVDYVVQCRDANAHASIEPDSFIAADIEGTPIPGLRELAHPLDDVVIFAVE